MSNDAYIPDYEEPDDSEMERYYAEWQSEREMQECQDALPEHKRADYRERMMDLADHIRDTERDDKLTGDI